MSTAPAILTTEGLEVAEQPSQLKSDVQEKEVVSTDGIQTAVANGPEPVDLDVFPDDAYKKEAHSHPTPWQRRRNRLLLIAAAVLVLVGIVVGVAVGVAGSRKKDSGNSITPLDGANLTSASDPASIPRPVGIRPDSSIFAQSYPLSAGSDLFNISIYFQDDENWIKESTFQSSTGEWTGPIQIVKAKPATPLSAFVYAGSFARSLFYLNRTNYLDERFRQGEMPGNPWVPGSTSSRNLLADPSTQIASQWASPYSEAPLNGFITDVPATLVFQRPGGELVESKTYTIGDGGHWNTGLIQGIEEALSGTALSLVQDRQAGSSSAGFKMFFQRKDSKLAVAAWTNETEWEIEETLNSRPAPGSPVSAASIPSSDGTAINLVYSTVTDVTVESWRSGQGWTANASMVRSQPAGAEKAAVSMTSLGRFYMIEGGILKEFGVEDGRIVETSRVPTA